MWISALPFLIIFFYSFLILKYRKGWLELKPYPDYKTKSYINVNVIIPFRDEEKNIEVLIDGLKKQKYPEEYIKYILVDDHSTDNSFNITCQLIRGDKRFKVLKINKECSGKKAALIKGLAESNAEVILFSDADCIHGPAWIISMVDAYLNQDADLVLGPVVFKRETGFISRFAEFEFAGLMGVTAASAYFKNPVISNGANLLVKRMIITNQQNIFNVNYASGDDMFLLMDFKKNIKNKIVFQKSNDAVALTNPPVTLMAFLSQRIRWVSKNRGIKDKDIFLNLIIVFLANLVLFISLLLLFIHLNYYYIFLVCFFIKIVVDAFYIKPVLDFINKIDLLKFIVVFQFFNLIYIPLIAFAGSFGSFTWKNRKYKK